MQAISLGSARCSIALLCLFLGLALAAQAPLKPPLAIPSDSKALIELAARINSLPAIDGKSWHIQASFENVGADGHSSEKGTFEEVWAGPSKFKRLLTSLQYTIVEYGSPNGVLRVGGAGRDDWALIVLHNSFAGPLSSGSDLDKMDIEAELSRVGSDTVRCVNLKSKPTAFTAPLVATKSFCFDPDSLFLRFGRDDRGTATASANPIAFQDRFVPGDVAVKRGSDLALTAHVDSLELLSNVPDAFFAPAATAEAAIATDQVNLPAQTAESYLAKRVQPIYPAIAKAAHIEGTVVLQVLIAKNGTVKEIGVQSGPPLLQQAAIDAVKQWVYKPYLVNGKVRSVYTTVNVIFILEK